MMAITDERLNSDSKFRCETITYFLFNSEEGLRQRLYDRLLATAMFHEFVDVKKDGAWLSHAFVTQQFNFPFKLNEVHKNLLEADVMFLVEIEAEHRERRRLAAELIALADGVHKKPRHEMMAALSSLIHVKSKLVTDLDGNQLYTARKNRPKGILTGIKRYDDLMYGLGYGTLAVIVGYVASYKSILKNCFLYNAAELGYTCVDINAEMPKDDLYFRYLARHSYHPKFHGKGEPVNSLHLQKALLNPDQEKFLWEVVEPDYKALPGKIIILEQMDVPGWDYLTLKSFFDTLGDVDVFSVDYIQQLMLEGIGAGARIRDAKDYGNWVIGECRKLAMGSVNPEEPGDYSQRKIGILVSQSNRDGWSEAVENSGAYSLRALSDLNMLDRASSYVFSVFVDDDLRAAGECKMQLLKHRGGAPALDPMPVPADPRFAVVGDGIAGFQIAPATTTAAIDIFSEGLKF